MVAFKSGSYGCHVGVYWGHTRVTSAPMVVDGGDDHIWYFYGNEATPLAHKPVSTQNLIIIATLAGVSRVLVNYEIEPLQGSITIGAALPAFDSVTASFYYYNATPLSILTKDFDVPYPEHNYELSIFGEPVYTLNHNYPAKVEFKFVMSAEVQRHLLTESMERGYFFILIDRYIDATYGLRAYEGPIVSGEVAAFQKGKSYLLPIVLEVQQRGLWTEATNTIDWTAFL
jgi:hypothetical protein